MGFTPAAGSGFNVALSTTGDFAVNTSQLYVDTSTGNVGIGTTLPGYLLHVYKSQNTDTQFVIENPNSGSLADASFAVKSGAAMTNFWQLSSTFPSSTRYLPNSGVLETNGVNGLAFNQANNSGFFRWVSRISGVDTEVMRITNTGNVGIGTTSPTNILSLGNGAARTIWSERSSVANSVGNTLALQASGATSGATDKAGGDLLLYPGVSTGSAESGIQLYGCVAGVSGTADRTQTKAIQILGNKLSFYNVTPVIRPTALTPTGTYTLNTGDAGSDTEITLIRTRINEIETKLQSLGLLT